MASRKSPFGNNHKASKKPANTQKVKKTPDPTQTAYRRAPERMLNQVMPYLLGLMAIFWILCFLFKNRMGVLGRGIVGFSFGCLGWASVLPPFFLLNLALFWRKDRQNGKLLWKSVATVFCTLLFAVLCFLPCKATLQDASFTQLYTRSRDLYIGGGLFGNGLGRLGLRGIGTLGTAFLSTALLLIFMPYLWSSTPRRAALRIFRGIFRKRNGVPPLPAADPFAPPMPPLPPDGLLDPDLFLPPPPVPPAPPPGVPPFPAFGVDIPFAPPEPVTPPMFGGTEGMPSEEDRIRHAVRQGAEQAKQPEFDPDTMIEQSSPIQRIPVPGPSAPIRHLEQDATVVIRRNRLQDEPKRPVAEHYVDDAVRFFGGKPIPTEPQKEPQEDPLPSTPSAAAYRPLRSVQAAEAPLASEPNTPDFPTVEASETGHASAAFAPPPQPQSASAYQQDAARFFGGKPAISVPPSAPTVAPTVAPAVSVSPIPEAPASAPRTVDAAPAEALHPLGKTDTPPVLPQFPSAPYTPPPINLLQPGRAPSQTDIGEEVRTNAERLIQAFEEFKIGVQITHVSRGPSVTCYEILPNAGVRVNQILNLADDIALRLAACGKIRIDAPLEGKQAVGIEVPNRVRTTVSMRKLIESEQFTNAAEPLTCALGEDISGSPVFLNMESMPHLLVAGATNSGKSVCINSLITSIVYKASPEQVQMILIDPKKVELTLYQGLPHLRVPVVTDPKKAAGVLEWAVGEMDRRYSLLEKARARKLAQYNRLAKERGDWEVLPLILIVIDELAELMMAVRDTVETQICRLLQKARAAGIHLLIGTQRPSVDVIPGLMKSNIPSRIAFACAAQQDSRTILGVAGAENLLGRGDMLYSPTGGKRLIRAQGAFITEAEIEAIVDFLSEQNVAGEYDEEILCAMERTAAELDAQSTEHAPRASEKSGARLDDRDVELLKQAASLAVQEGQISASNIQIYMGMGFQKAKRFLIYLEQLGIVGKADGQKPRKVLISREELQELMVREDAWQVSA